MPLYSAPAKLNRFLHVVGRRADGYHLLQSAMVLIDLADTLDIEPTDAPDIVLTTPLPGVPPERDLCVRAALRLQQATGTRRGARIALDKRIPMGGGLGGGSSDAATVLIALNHLWGTGLDRAALMALGLALGADVPFFIFGESAWVEGIGERLTALPHAERAYLVLRPPVAVPTPEIFSAPELTRDAEPVKISDFASLLQSGLDVRKCEHFRNDLEPVAVRRYPVIGEYLGMLGEAARMSGSGSCVFAPFLGMGEAVAARSRLGSNGEHAIEHYVAAALSRHPHDPLVPSSRSEVLQGSRQVG